MFSVTPWFIILTDQGDSSVSVGGCGFRLNSSSLRSIAS